MFETVAPAVAVTTIRVAVRDSDSDEDTWTLIDDDYTKRLPPTP